MEIMAAVYIYSYEIQKRGKESENVTQNGRQGQGTRRFAMMHQSISGSRPQICCCRRGWKVLRLCCCWSERNESEEAVGEDVGQWDGEPDVDEDDALFGVFFCAISKDAKEQSLEQLPLVQKSFYNKLKMCGERIIISNFINKISKELKLNSN